MPKFLTKINFAFQYLKALKYAEKGEYQKIISTIEKYRSFVDLNMTNKLSEYYILLGESYFNMTNYRIAEGYFLTAIQHIDKQKNLNIDEQNYLEYYIYNLLFLTYNRLYAEEKAKQCLNIVKKINYDEKK